MSDPVVDGGRPRPAARLAIWLAYASLVVWLVGQLATDRVGWSQFIWWTPEPVFALLATPAVVGSLRVVLRRGTAVGLARLIACSAPAAVILVSVLWNDIGWRRWDALLWKDRSHLQLIQWNASWPSSLGGDASSAELLALEPDVAVVSNPYKLLGDGRLERWRARGYDAVNLGVFLVLARLPVIEARVVTSVEGRVGASVVVARDGRWIRMLAVDLPSDPAESRRDLAARFRAELDSARPAGNDDGWDIVLGDLNIPRGSASLELLFDRPSRRYVDAWTAAGAGVGASWPSRVPLVQIDHVLLAPTMRSLQARFIQIGGAVHRAQQATIEVLPDGMAARPAVGARP